MRITGYNGKANDTQVTVAILLGNGLPGKGCSSSVLGPAGFYIPGWCGNNTWLVSSDPVLTTNAAPVLFSEFGYVHDHQLVVSFRGPVKLPLSESASVIFNQTALSGKLVGLHEDMSDRNASALPTLPEQRLWRFEGLMTGRSSTNDVLETFGNIKLGSTNLFCTQPMAFDYIIQQVCPNSDVTLSGSDNTSAPCDAVSVAVGLTAEPALTGAVSDAGLEAGKCTPGAPTAPKYKCP